MSLLLEEDQSFQLSGYVESPGYVRIVPRGYIVQRRGEEVYVAPLIPQLFYGASGEQLRTWRQYVSSAGEQVLLSRRAGGYPEVPREELYWRRVPLKAEAVEAEAVAAPDMTPLLILGGLFLLFLWSRR